MVSDRKRSEKRKHLYRSMFDQAERRFQFSFVPSQANWSILDLEQLRLSQPANSLLQFWLAADRIARLRVEECYLKYYRFDTPISYFHWVYMGEPNAIASNQGEFDIVAMSGEMLFAVFATVNSLFAHPETFPSVGSRSMEALPSLGSAKSVFGKSIEFDSLRGPKCPVRSLVAYQVGLDLINFLIEHELQHLRRGHIGLGEINPLGAIIGLHSANVYSQGNLNGIPHKLTLQAIECQADGPALTMAIRNVLHDQYKSRQDLVGQGMPSQLFDEFEQVVRPDEITRVYWLYVAVHILFGVVLREDVVKGLDESSHPPSWSRGLLATVSAFATFKNLDEFGSWRVQLGRISGKALGDTSAAAALVIVDDGVDYSAQIASADFALPYH